MPVSGYILFFFSALLPAFTMMWLSSASLYTSTFILFDNIALFFLPIAVVRCATFACRRLVLFVLACAWTTRAFFLSVFIIYWRFTGHQFDLFFALDALRDIPTTVNKLFPGGFLLLSLSLLFLSLAVFILEYRLLRHFVHSPRKRHTNRLYQLVTALILIAEALSPSTLKPLWDEARNLPALLHFRSAVRPLFAMPDVQPIPKSGTPVVFLQLESGNAHALNGQAVVANKRFPGEFMPHFKEVAKNGVLFPYAWSGSIQTHRSLLNTLCSGTNNIGIALAENPDKIPVTCLPELLRNAGYSTLFYKAFDDLSYQNHDLLSRRIGFQKILGKTIMPREHKQLSWGFDDCEFYKAVFSNLKQRTVSTEGLFLYLATAAHHYPFQGTARYPKVHAFKNPMLFIEFYLNSALEQDHCLPTFYSEFTRFFGGNAHLFVFADHSVPVGTRGGTINMEDVYNENFSVPLAYIPPKNSSMPWKHGEVSSFRPALTDLPATVLELLTGRVQQNSFVSELVSSYSGLSKYENCHTLVQPYGPEPQIAVVQFPIKHVYFVHSKTVVKFDLENDPGEQYPDQIATDFPYESFLDRFMCRRFLSAESKDSINRNSK